MNDAVEDSGRLELDVAVPLLNGESKLARGPNNKLRRGEVDCSRGTPQKTRQQASPRRGRLQPVGATENPPTSFGIKK